MNQTIDFPLLKKIVACISTPGDEDQVMSLLLRQWQKEAGWSIETLGRQAILARSANWQKGRKTMLVTAHADSPGFIISEIDQESQTATLVSLGHPNVPEDAKVTVKTDNGQLIEEKLSESGPHAWTIPLHPEFRRGNRAAFTPRFVHQRAFRMLQAPFFDNRIGCYLLCRLQKMLELATPSVNLVLAATADEEFSGFGASVLATHCQADFVVCLDTTYVAPEQGVELGQGPVLTLTDASVLVGRKVEQCLLKQCACWNLPLQTEIYNFSGTDAKAFPRAGATAVILPILIASEGNHSPLETIAICDVTELERLLVTFATDTSAVEALCKANVWHK